MIKLVLRIDGDRNNEIHHNWAKDGSMMPLLRERGWGIEGYQPRNEADDVVSLEADGDELIGIMEQLPDVPQRAGVVKSVIWFGDMAKFIYANFDETAL